MAYTANIIANNVLQRAFRDQIPVTPMKLQKILYFAASEYAKTTGKPLLAEQFEAWQYGPVIRSVYSEFKPFGGGAIRGYAKDAQGQAFVTDENFDHNLADVLNKVWERTKSRDAVELSRITHEEGSAWHDAMEKNSPYIGAEQVASDTSYIRRLEMNSFSA